MLIDTEVRLIVKLFLLAFVASIIAFCLYNVIPGYGKLINDSAGFIIAILIVMTIRKSV